MHAALLGAVRVAWSLSYALLLDKKRRKVIFKFESSQI